MIAVVGAGGMGSAIAENLRRDYEVILVDTDQKRLDGTPESGKFMGRIMGFQGLDSVDLAVVALPAGSARETVEFLLKSGKNVVDISLTDYDPLELDGMARENGATLIPHAGFAPGLSNILAGKLYYELGSRNIEIIVGGLQERPEPPMEYAPTFNVSSVIDEYTREARFVENGNVRALSPLDTIEPVHVEGIGDLECFVSDGLSTILGTFREGIAIEKTVRHPGYLSKMKFLRDMGYFETVPVAGLTPREVTEKLFSRIVSGQKDLSILEVRSLDRGLVYSCIDQFDTTKGISSMRRMTGYTAAAISRALINGMVEVKGMYPAEYMGKSREAFDYILGQLRKDNIVVNAREQPS